MNSNTPKTYPWAAWDLDTPTPSVICPTCDQRIATTGKDGKYEKHYDKHHNHQ